MLQLIQLEKTGRVQGRIFQVSFTMLSYEEEALCFIVGTLPNFTTLISFSIIDM